MFNKKSCSKCGKKIKDNFDFCPYCGKPSDDNNKWGMLGKNDVVVNQNPFESMGFGGGFFNKMIGNAMKMIEKEMQREMKNIETPKSNAKIQLYVNGKKIPIGEGNIKVIKKPKKNLIKKPSNKKQPTIIKTFSPENQKKFSNLPRQNPETNVRRLSDRVIYEINIPGVKSAEDIAIRNLQNSIEIKAIAKKIAYYKILSVAFPIIDFYLENEKLILELEAKN